MPADRPFAVEPLFTRDPRHISELQILMAMMVIRGIYERHGVTSLNHGIGFDTAAIELLLPTYGERSACKGQDLPQLGPESAPDADPGDRERLGGERPLLRQRSWAWRTTSARARTCSSPAHDGTLRSNRVLCQLAGQYGVDLFIGSTLQMDADGNSSTVTLGPPGRIRRRSQHGTRSARPPPQHARLARA